MNTDNNPIDVALERLRELDAQRESGLISEATRENQRLIVLTDLARAKAVQSLVRRIKRNDSAEN
jgi:hypothetical protein